MPTEIVRHQTPEEAELLRKREELAAVRAELAELELELADQRAQLKSFEGRYLRQVGVLYAELDEWEARIAELEASLGATVDAQRRAGEARQRADETHEATHGEASQAQDFQPSGALKSLFREVAKCIHPDFAKDADDQQRRTRLMAEANLAYSCGDDEALRRILDDYQVSSESIQGEGIGSELIRIIRQLHQARKNIATIERELSDLKASEIAHLKRDTEVAHEEERDLLAELAATVNIQIVSKKAKYEAMAHEVEGYGK